jgi:hypothetical protein
MKLKTTDGSVYELYQRLTGEGIEMSKAGAIEKIARDLGLDPKAVTAQVIEGMVR